MNGMCRTYSAPLGEMRYTQRYALGWYLTRFALLPLRVSELRFRSAPHSERSFQRLLCT